MIRFLQISLLALALGGASLSAEASAPSEQGDTLQSFRPGPGRPGRPGRPNPGRPPRPMMKVCFADNARGVVFRASGHAYDQYVQEDAMRQCEYNSFNPYSCRPLGCRYQ